MTSHHQVITSVFSCLCPGLALVWIVQWLLRVVVVGRALRARRLALGWRPLFLLSLISFGLLARPVNGIPLGRWFVGFNANFSIPLTGILLAALWHCATGREVFAPRDWAAGWIFGCLAGFVLYPFALGWGAGDPYTWGWSFGPLFIGNAILTAFLIWRQNRFGFLLLFSIAAYHLRLLESANYWDYLVDPVYWLLSLFMVCRQLTKLWQRRSNCQAT